MGEKMKIITLDTREQNADFIKYLTNTAYEKGYKVELEALPFGDIKYENIVIERKEINDFCGSVCSDRMFNQIHQMKSNPDYSSIIAISGTYDNLWKDNKNKIPHLEGALRQIMAWGIPVMQCSNDVELVDKILKLFEYDKPTSTPIKRVDKDDKLSLFMALPNVGRTGAKKLFSKWSNMVELCAATMLEIQKVLGPKKGEQVYNSLRK